MHNAQQKSNIDKTFDGSEILHGFVFNTITLVDIKVHCILVEKSTNMDKSWKSGILHDKVIQRKINALAMQ